MKSLVKGITLTIPCNIFDWKESEEGGTGKRVTGGGKRALVRPYIHIHPARRKMQGRGVMHRSRRGWSLLTSLRMLMPCVDDTPFEREAGRVDNPRCGGHN